MLPSHAKIHTSISDAIAHMTPWRVDEKSIVFTNGCFDILHAGHISYLEEAKLLGDKLIVGLNSDASITRIKGHRRPIIKQKDRARVLAALESIDMVILFDEDTPIELIKIIKPQFLVKGGDYRESEMIGADIVSAYNGIVHTLSLTHGISTTEIIKRIQAD